MPHHHGHTDTTYISACADDLKWLEPPVLQTLKHMLPLHMWQWLTALAANTEPPEWAPFHRNANTSPSVQLASWQKHAKLPASFSIPECLGVRTVRDLEHVSPEMHVTVIRPVQQARLRWTLHSYRDQLAKEKRKQSNPNAASGSSGPGQREQGDPDAASGSSGPRQREEGDPDAASGSSGPRQREQGDPDAASGPSEPNQRKQNEREKGDARQQAVDDQKPAAQEKVAAAYATHGSSNNVHGFVEQLSPFYGRLNVTTLNPKPAPGTADWKAKMLKLLRQVRLMAAPDKCPPDALPFQHAMALQITIQLAIWEARFKS